MTIKQEIIKLENISQIYSDNNQQKIILENVNLKLYKKEIVSLLGRSGSGKSTLLRIIAGLINPTSGKRFCNDEEYTDILDNMSMIFQSFALFPWLTVQQNIEICLESDKNLTKSDIHEKTSKVLEMIGLSGYEAAFPREISGGMRQRVGFARAFITNPKIILMDEPFSALDVLTAQMLKTDFIDLWIENKTSLQTVLLVTHNIEESVLLSDRILIFSSNPGRVISEIEVDIPHPRDRLSPVFKDLVEHIYGLMTSDNKTSKSINNQNLPNVSIGKFISLIQILYNDYEKTRPSLTKLFEEYKSQAAEILLVIDLLKLLKFIEIKDDLVYVTSSGKILATSPHKIRKQIVAEHLIQYVPFIGFIRRTLDENLDKIVPRETFTKELEKIFSNEDASKQLDLVINWGRYSGLFFYDQSLQKFYLYNPKKNHS